MYSIQEALEPLVTEYNRYLNGHYLSDLLQFKGQAGIGNEYISKVFRSQAHEKASKYEHAVESVRNPTYAGFLQDNWFRIFALNAVERLVVAYQAAPSLPRVGRPNSLSFLFTEIMNDGAFRGTLRGVSLSAIQSSLVLWPAIALTNRSKGDIKSFVTTYCILDALLYPLDALKNRMYANTASPLNLRQALSSFNFKHITSGLVNKLIFSLPFSAAIYSTSQRDENSWLYWLATAALYPVNTLKVRAQTATHIIRGTLYRGVVPFIGLNYLVAWELTALFSKDKVNSLLEQSLH